VDLDISEGWAMNEKNLSLARRAGIEYRKTTRAHIAKLQGDLTAAEYRAETAERQVRQIAAEKDIWKHRAQEAEAALKSTGRTP
jgi:hypothetical protein